MILGIAAVVATGLVAGSAQAAPRMRSTADDVQRFTSDGQRYLAFQRGQRLTVLDTKTGRRYATNVLGGCSLGRLPAGSLEFPMVLVSCGKTDDQAALLDVRTRSMLRLPTGQTWQSLGRDWVEGGTYASCPGAAGTCQPFFQWHTGVTRYLPIGELQHAGPPLQFLDPNLNAPGLTIAAPCAPHQDQSSVSTDDSMDAPYLLVGNDGTPVFPAGLRLGRCGTGRTRTLTTAAGTSAELSAGSVSWAHASTAYDFVITAGRTYHWKSPSAWNFDTSLTVEHTRYDVLIARTTKQACAKTCTPTAFDLYLATVPPH